MEQRMTQVNYNDISQVYDDVRRADVDLLNLFLAEVEIGPASCVLDIGCGTGNHTDVLQRITQAQVCGVEPSEGMIDKARAKNVAIDFQQGDAAHIPFEDHRFDFAYMTDVIHHVPDLAAMCVEIRRVLKPGGKLCISTQSHDQIARRPIARFFPGTVRVDQGRYPDIDRIVEIGQANGMAFIKADFVYEGEPRPIDAGFLELVRKKGYSMLHLIDDSEYQAGLREVEQVVASGGTTLPAAGETLVWLRPTSI
jgi:SAM-dependent methyltransferase